MAARDEEWLSLRELAELTDTGEASVSAQLRNLRKEPYSLRIEKQQRRDPEAALGFVWEYRLGRAAWR